MNSKKDEWDAVLTRLTQQNEEVPQKQPSLFSGLFLFGILNSLSALLLMLSNMVIEHAWPSLTALSPGIGYADACYLSGIFWVLFAIKAAITSSMNRMS